MYRNQVLLLALKRRTHTTQDSIEPVSHQLDNLIPFPLNLSEEAPAGVLVDFDLFSLLLSTISTSSGNFLLSSSLCS